jgi:hypothetical protein
MGENPAKYALGSVLKGLYGLMLVPSALKISPRAEPSICSTYGCAYSGMFDVFVSV